MKNLFYLSVLVLTAGLTACASDDTRNYRYNGDEEGCSDTLIKEEPKPAPAPVQQVKYQPAPAPVVQNCGCPMATQDCGCPAREYTVRTPVKVIFKNTTYRTVYEPRTFETTTYETRPYNRAEVCTDGHCAQPAFVGRQPVIMNQPVNHPVMVNQPQL